MAKYDLRLKARKMRLKGQSVKSLAKKLNASKGSVSLWTRDIILTAEQLEKLKTNSVRGSEKGRIKGSLIQRQRRLDQLAFFEKEGISLLNDLKETSLLVAGVALYWGEGCKKTPRVEFCNSDPRVIEFMTLWLVNSLGVDPNDLRARVSINALHEKREEIVREYWSRISGIPLEQFKKTSFKRVVNKKVYENFDSHYGTLTVTVAKPGQLYPKILGLIEGLSSGGIKNLRQRSSGVRAEPS